MINTTQDRIHQTVEEEDEIKEISIFMFFIVKWVCF